MTRAIAIGIGTPTQIFALRPSTALNNIRVNNVADCVSTANNSCVGSLGGVFDQSQSSAYTVAVKGAWNGSHVENEESEGAYVYFNDRVTFERRGYAYGFPVALDSDQDGGR